MPRGLVPQRETLGQKERGNPTDHIEKGHLGLSETDAHATEGGSFEELHEQVGALEQRALGELENALKAIAGHGENLAEPPAANRTLPYGGKGLWRDLSGFPDLFLICIGPDRRAIYINNAMLKSLGYVAEETADVDAVRMFFHESEWQRVEGAFSRLLDEYQPLSFEARARTKDQGALSVAWQWKRIRPSDETLEYILGIGMRRPLPEGLFQVGSDLYDVGATNRLKERKGSRQGVNDSAKKRLRMGFYSRWAYVVVYFLTSATICVLGALSGSKAVYYNGWLVFLNLTHGLHKLVLPDRDFMFAQELFGDHALLVGGAIFFLLPALFAVALVNAARSFGKE